MSTSVPTPAEIAALPKAEFAFPGPLRDQLVAAILTRAKTSTTGLAVDYEHEDEDEALPKGRPTTLWAARAAAGQLSSTSWSIPADTHSPRS